MYILKWKDGVECEQQFEHQSEMMRRVYSLLSIPPDDGCKIEISERHVKADDSVTLPAFEHESNNMLMNFHNEMDMRGLTLADLLILEQRLNKMQSYVDALKQAVNEPKE